MSAPLTARGAANREKLERLILDALGAAAGPMTAGEVANAVYPAVLADRAVREVLAGLIGSGRVVRLPHPTVRAPGASVYAVKKGGATP